MTNTFGYYRFNNLAAGETYVFAVKGKGWVFAAPTRVLTVNEDFDGLNFTASSSSETRR